MPKVDNGSKGWHFLDFLCKWPFTMPKLIWLQKRLLNRDSSSETLSLIFVMPSTTDMSHCWKEASVAVDMLDRNILLPPDRTQNITWSCRPDFRVALLFPEWAGSDSVNWIWQLSRGTCYSQCSAGLSLHAAPVHLVYSWSDLDLCSWRPASLACQQLHLAVSGRHW